MYLLVHGVGELHTRQDLLQEVAQIGGIGLGDVGCRDELRQHGGVGEQLRRACTRHDDLLHFDALVDGVARQVCPQRSGEQARQCRQDKDCSFHHISGSPLPSPLLPLGSDWKGGGYG